MRTLLDVLVKKHHCIKGAAGVYFTSIHIVGELEFNRLVMGSQRVRVPAVP